jgi:hypothetical protein
MDDISGLGDDMRGIEGRDDLRTVRAKVTGQILTLDDTLQDTVHGDDLLATSGRGSAGAGGIGTGQELTDARSSQEQETQGYGRLRP